MAPKGKIGSTSYHVKFNGLHACLKNNRSVHNIRSMLVSHAFVDLWRMIEQDMSFDKTLFNSLDDAEHEFMKYLLNKCKITSRRFESAYNEGLDVYVKRLKHLQDAQDIGDDNPNIKKEMLSILDTLYNKGVFTPGYYNAFKRAITNRNADGK